ncbi:hypothetical protein ACFLV6_02630 [Chloroflexota bacterium]
MNCRYRFIFLVIIYLEMVVLHICSRIVFKKILIDMENAINRRAFAVDSSVPLSLICPTNNKIQQT